MKGHGDQERCLRIGKKQISPQPSERTRRRRNYYHPVSLTSILGKVKDHLILEHISIHMDDRKVIRMSQHELTKGKSCLSNLIALCNFYKQLPVWIEGRAGDIIWLDFGKAFDIASDNAVTGSVAWRSGL